MESVSPQPSPAPDEVRVGVRDYVLDDEELARLRRREPAAQARFFRAFRERVEQLCARILGQSGDAQELAADILGDFLYTYVDGVTTPRAVPTYLKLMATRRSLRLHKSKGRSDELEDDQFIDGGAEHDPADQADHSIWARQVAPKLGSCMGALTPKAREVLRLRFGTDLTNEAIGDIVGGSKQYIGRLIKESTEKLKTCLES